MGASVGSTSILELQKVSKAFGRFQVLNDLSFQLNQGEVLGILGPNGAGKTTMLNLISGDYPVSEGRILFNGREITTESTPRRCQLGIGRTYQIPRPFVGMTVYENMLVGATYGRSTHQRQRHAPDLCREILHRIGLLAQADVMAGNLRLLDRKRLELARALATEPVLLLLDEIAGGLTEREVQQLLEVIADIRVHNLTIIWIEHIVHALAATADRIMVINFGVKLAEGPPREILESREFQEVYFGVDSIKLT